MVNKNNGNNRNIHVSLGGYQTPLIAVILICDHKSIVLSFDVLVYNFHFIVTCIVCSPFMVVEFVNVVHRFHAEP